MKRQLIERLDEGPVICAEGFLFEVEKRGYLASGEFVPMVSLEHPEALENLHKDFQHAGSDIVEEQDKFSIYIKKGKEVLPWKDFNKNMAIAVEYNLEY